MQIKKRKKKLAITHKEMTEITIFKKLNLCKFWPKSLEESKPSTLRHGVNIPFPGIIKH
jgi:hypothetical protein